MFRRVSLERLQRTFAAVARKRAHEEASDESWALPAELVVELFLLELGLSVDSDGEA